jgi:hypothetical protein
MPHFYKHIHIKSHIHTHQQVSRDNIQRHTRSYIDIYNAHYTFGGLLELWLPPDMKRVVVPSSNGLKWHHIFIYCYCDHLVAATSNRWTSHDCIMIPYNFKKVNLFYHMIIITWWTKTIICLCLCRRHWILAMICPKVGRIFIMRPLDIDESSYMEFINCTQR